MAPDGNLAKDLLQLEVSKSFCDAEVSSYYCFIKTIIFQCSKNYGGPIRITRLKDAPKMDDPISFNETRL